MPSTRKWKSWNRNEETGGPDLGIEADQKDSNHVVVVLGDGDVT
jgi:hypothetical protein